MTTEKCRYMEAAYPDLDAQDTCGYGEHRHDAQTFALARAFANVCQQLNPTDEQIAWFLEDAAAVVDDFDPIPPSWWVGAPEVSTEAGLESTLTINDTPYVIQEPGHKETSHPLRRETWEQWIREANEAAGVDTHGEPL